MKKICLGNTGIEVSEMCLGTMYFGSRVEEETAFALLDAYVDRGGNFVDTSNNYCFWLDGFTGDESEITLGRWMAERKNRNEVYLATKCGVRPINQQGDFEGLSRSAIMNAVEGSLKRLKTDHIDLYYMHVDWRATHLEETLGAFYELIEQGKVGNIAASNMSTWRLIKAKEISRQNGWKEIAAIQQWYSYLRPRDGAALWVQKFADEELFDYCEAEKDTTVLAYTLTLGGLYGWDSIYERNHPALGTRFFSEDNERRLETVKELSRERGVSPFQVVFAWLRKHRIPIIPILGVRTMSQLQDNLKSLDWEMSPEEFERMSKAAFNHKEYEKNEPVKLL